MRFQYKLIDTWPPLVWLAKASAASMLIEIFHGSGIETSSEWFCEAIWADQYCEGDFDRTDIIFGSGGRIRGENAIFVSSSTTVDRIQSAVVKGCSWVSNSLPCLLTALGAVVDPRYQKYFEDFESIVHGIKEYKRTLMTSNGDVKLTYYNNLRWDGSKLVVNLKPSIVRDFSSFLSYRDFLESSLRRLVENMSAKQRTQPFRMLGTLSSGYDSPTVAALARKAGLREAISFNRARNGEIDSGAEIGKILGMKVFEASRDAWASMGNLPEVPFLASDAKGEDSYFKAFEPQLAQRVLLTGFHGDKVWDRNCKALSDNIVRGDQSGLSLTEYRLRVGFIHCPLPFLGVRQIRDINSISRSPEMTSWSISRRYDRPICRRIVEEAGVPRRLFGIRKKQVSVLFFGRPNLSPGAWRDYVTWLKKQNDDQQRIRLRMRSRFPSVMDRVVATVARTMDEMARLTPPRVWLMGSLAGKLSNFRRRDSSLRYAFPWAIERAKGIYMVNTELGST